MKETLLTYVKCLSQKERLYELRKYWGNNYTPLEAKRDVIQEIESYGFNDNGFNTSYWRRIYVPKSYQGRKAVAMELIDMHTYNMCEVCSSDDVEEAIPSQLLRYCEAWKMFEEYNGLDMHIELAVEQLTQHFSGNFISVDKFCEIVEKYCDLREVELC